MSWLLVTRMKNELATLKRNPTPGVCIRPVTDGDLHHYHASIDGPPDTPYEGGIFILDVNLSDDYPYKPPKVVFTTRMFHPNIYPDGQICLDILGSQWAEALSLESVLISISVLLADPNIEEPANPEAAHYYREDPEQYNRIVRQYVQQYASQNTVS
ncbi:unnamed protein product [Rotaria sp. Silwood1]|nr:unnamed protein product [Rotaria sp. Silwood1]CAF1553196.1 unnamed protein product [Rotaria sp. Silwood1]